MLWLPLSILLSAGSARGEAVLDEVRVFSGDGHDRILLVLSAAPGVIEGRSVQGGPRRDDQVVVRLGDSDLGAAGPREVPVEEDGLRRIELRAAGADAELVVHLPGPRDVRTQLIGETAVLVDLLEEGRGVDPALPSATQLRAWLDDVGLSSPTAAIPPAARGRIVVDAGHGGWDHGAVGLTGTREADIALQIALRTARILEDDYGFEVLLTRDEDVFISLRDRAALANSRDADLFLSIHANAAPGPTAWGIETYSFDTASDGGAARVARRENAIRREQRAEQGRADATLARMLVAGTNALSRQLSEEVQARAVERLREDFGDDQIRDLGAKTALFSVLVSTRMPSVLFESGFVSNADDERRLRSPHYQEQTARALAEAVDRWFGTRPAGEGPPGGASAGRAADAGDQLP